MAINIHFFTSKGSTGVSVSQSKTNVWLMRIVILPWRYHLKQSILCRDIRSEDQDNVCHGPTPRCVGVGHLDICLSQRTVFTAGVSYKQLSSHKHIVYSCCWKDADHLLRDSKCCKSMLTRNLYIKLNLVPEQFGDLAINRMSFPSYICCVIDVNCQ